ncbi:RING finger protein (macronuclear) [Tetrahymena thermophila SB210]|uniref:RING finger protein n=1 Tax=Tetrahymena thermophila (strain SB210) TaxID=312017 RepID=W7X7C8_TETTS|nr:RING finger protein [Tetrahymena thermophila SB210]EWS73272.1 RING finger protein [Tetrahymena thermophila SB210]|eukprot:XP_012654181.1 RING finger protein [Tetrahymena thermophila SB210]
MVKTRNQQNQQLLATNTHEVQPQRENKTIQKQKKRSQANRASKKTQRNQTIQQSNSCQEDCLSSNENSGCFIVETKKYPVTGMKSNKKENSQKHTSTNTEEIECPICLVEIKNKLSIFKCQTCSKEFHSHCISDWFSKKDLFNCPICNCSPFK